MSTRKLFAGTWVSLLLSLAVYAVLAGLASWHYYAGFLSDPEVEFGPSRLVWMKDLWLGLSYFIAPICLWWLVVFVAAARWQMPTHRRFARADLWLLLAAILWILLLYAAATRRLPMEFTFCSIGSIEGLCRRAKPGLYWAVIAFSAAVFFIGLVHRVRALSRRVQPADLNELRNDAVAAWIKTIPSETRLSRCLARVPVELRDEVERSARAIYAAVNGYLDEAAKAGDVDLETFCPALEAHLTSGFPWMSETAFGALRSNLGWYSWQQGYSVSGR